MDKKTAIKLLKKIKSIAEHASMTGALEGGVEMLIKTYKNIYSLAIQNKWLEEGLLPEITPENLEQAMSMDNLGIAAALLNAMLEE